MKVFKIVLYNLIGKMLYTCEEMPELEMKDDRGYKRFYEKGTNTEAFRTHLWSYATTPKANAINPKERFMPFWADVTEDVSQQYKKFATTYEGCQLMTEKHGGYLQFWHEPTKQVLRIAMNSHYYTPIEAKELVG